MLTVVLGKAKAGTQQERNTRRLEWQYPEGIRVIGEYWPIGGEYDLIIVAEAEGVPATAAVAAWRDVFDFTVIPVITAEEGLQLIKQMMPK